MAEQQKDICTLRQFERNRYFYGKLLTVRDFETEQSYFRGKGALINRIIHGGGIVCGLEVSELKEEDQKFTINLSAGVAIDCCGREIVVSASGPVDVVGQLQDGSNYLYLKHKECYKESVPVLADPSACEEKCAYNRILEIFEVVVSDQAPEEIPFEFNPELLKGDPAQDYYEQYLTTCPECAEPENARVLLAVVDKTIEGITRNDNLTRQHRVIVPNNPMLYKLLNIHTTDFNNPHETTAEQVKALKSINDVGNVDEVPYVSNIDLVSNDDSITITGDPDADNQKIDLSVTPATQVSSVSDTKVVGTSPHAAPDDHVHDLADGVVTTPKIADNAVTTAKIANNAVTEAKIADNAVTTVKIANNAVTTAKINTGAVTAARIANNAVTTDKIADDAVTKDKIRDGDVVTSINNVNPAIDGNINLVEGDNITITPETSTNSITISAAGGLGIEPDLTTLEIVNWKHAQPDVPLSVFEAGLSVNFIGNTPVNLGSTPEEVFLVAAKLSSYMGIGYNYEYLPGTITLAAIELRGSPQECIFKPDSRVVEYLRSLIGETQVAILVQIKCDFIIDNSGNKAVDGHHIGGTGRSGLIRDPDGAYVGGIRGGVFESWFNLVSAPEATITLTPVSGTIGTSVTVAGQNFGANETVQILFGDIQVSSVTTDVQGNFVMSFNVPDAPPGLTPVQGTGEASGRVAEAQFTVIASLEEKIYWTAANAPAIQRANLDGTNVESIVKDVVFPIGIAVDAVNGKIYWTDGEMGAIQNADLDGLNVNDVVTGLSGLSGIAVDAVVGRHIYWTDPRRNLIQRANLDGSNIEGIAKSGNPIGIAVDTVNRKIYWTDGAGEILSANLDGSAVQVVVGDLSRSPRGIDVDTVNKKIYWTDGVIIQRANLDGAGIEDIVTEGLESAMGITVDAVNKKIYWTDSGVDRIQRANLDGTDVETIVTQISDPQFIAIFSYSV